MRWTLVSWKWIRKQLGAVKVCESDKLVRKWVIIIDWMSGFFYSVRFCAIRYLYLEFGVSFICHSSLENTCSGMSRVGQVMHFIVGCQEASCTPPIEFSSGIPCPRVITSLTNYLRFNLIVNWQTAGLLFGLLSNAVQCTFQVPQ